MGLWFTECQTPSLRLGFRVQRMLHREQSPYQDILLVDTEQYGPLLALNGAVQTAVGDEFAYHEMLVHVPLLAHPDPRQVLIVGGGDGGSVREVLKHATVERVVLVEIDARVVDVAKRFLPQLSQALEDARCHVVVGDGIEYVKGARGGFDVILVDSTDPVGPARGLFTEAFFRDASAALRGEGLLVVQTESPFLHRDLIVQTHGAMTRVFPRAQVYLTSVPTYPSGLWSFTVGSQGPDAAAAVRPCTFPTRYYTPEIHRAAFALPAFLREVLRHP